MKLRIIFILTLLAIYPAYATVSPADDLMKIGVGARPMGMGKAFVAVADDANSIFLNPAGLSGSPTWEFTSMYVNMFEGDLPYTLLSYSFPLHHGEAGIGLIMTGTSNIPSPSSQTISYFDYNDRLLFLSYADDARQLFRGRDVHLGANLKLFSKGYSGSQNESGFGFNADLGIKYYHNPWLTFGANLQNMLPTKINWTTQAQDDMPVLLKLGGAAKIFKESATLALDMDFPVGRGIPSLFHLGTEWPVNKILTLRAGFDQALSAASNVISNPTLGVSFNFSGFSLDYAFHGYQDGYSDTAHFISFSLFPVSRKL